MGKMVTTTMTMTAGDDNDDNDKNDDKGTTLEIICHVFKIYVVKHLLELFVMR